MSSANPSDDRNNVAVQDWNGTVQGLIKKLWETGIDSDVQFSVVLNVGSEEKQLIKAHKFVLSMSSSIFADQFRSSNRSSSSSSAGSQQNDATPIEIIDIKASSFKAMLHFLYTKDISMVSKKNFVGVYSAAKKYSLNALIQKCIELAETMLCVRNVFGMLRMAKLHEETLLIAHCWALIDRRIDSCVMSEMIITLSREEIGELLARDTLECANEMLLFEQLHNWAQKQCENEGNNDQRNGQARAKMGELLYAIRFPMIPPMDFINLIVPLDILSKEEITATLLHYSENVNSTLKAEHPLPFSDRPRAIQLGEHNKLVDKFVAEMEKSELRGENERLRKENERLEKKLNDPTELRRKMRLLSSVEPPAAEEKGNVVADEN